MESSTKIQNDLLLEIKTKKIKNKYENYMKNVDSMINYIQSNVMIPFKTICDSLSMDTPPDVIMVPYMGKMCYKFVEECPACEKCKLNIDDVYDMIINMVTMCTNSKQLFTKSYNELYGRNFNTCCTYDSHGHPKINFNDANSINTECQKLGLSESKYIIPDNIKSYSDIFKNAFDAMKIKENRVEYTIINKNSPFYNLTIVMSLSMIYGKPYSNSWDFSISIDLDISNFTNGFVNKIFSLKMNEYNKFIKSSKLYLSDAKTKGKLIREYIDENMFDPSNDITVRQLQEKLEKIITVGKKVTKYILSMENKLKSVSNLGHLSNIDEKILESHKTYISNDISILVKIQYNKALRELTDNTINKIDDELPSYDDIINS